jgi:hypothetical protein
MRELRRRVARLIMFVVAIAVIYVLTQLGDPEYVPAPGWVIATASCGIATWWAAQYCELPGFPRQE